MSFTVYIALLRGINVGGHGKIRMADLRERLDASGFGRVQTYIQSGNVTFVSDDRPETLEARMERLILDSFGIKTTAMVRSRDEWKETLANCPYDAEEIRDGESLHVALLRHIPTADAVKDWGQIDPAEDEFCLVDRAVYMHLRQSIVDSKRAQGLHKLRTEATTRNWNTMNKLADLAEAYGEPE